MSATKSGAPAPTLSEMFAAQDPEKIQKLSVVMAEATRESQGLMNDILAGSTFSSLGGPSKPDPFGASTAFGKVSRSLMTHPANLMNANMELWQGWVGLFQDMMSGNHLEPSRDRRFSDPEWSQNPTFEFMRRTYELNTRWMMSVIDAADDLSDADRRRARFFAKQTADAFSPTNFFATNPTVMKKMLETGGESVLEGLRQARADLKRGGGKLMISQTDETPFEIGVNVATAPGQVVFRNDLIELIQFAPSRKKVFSTPLLILPPWINKYYILDLREENSMIRWLTSKGYTVFVVSWRSADETTKDYTWDDYIEQGAFAALDATLEASGAEAVNAVGYCIGGSLLTGALAYMAKKKDKRIKSATFFASQSDFKLAGDLLAFTSPEGVALYEGLIEENQGIMPGEAMGETFNWLRPVDLVWRYVVDNYMMGKKPRPFDLLYWNADQTNIPGPLYKTYLRDLYGENALAEGRFKVLGEPVNLKDIKIPALVQAGREDHICPFDSVYRTARALGGDTTFVLAGSGHIAGVVNHPDAKKYQHWINEDLPESAEAWLKDAEELPGSWWPTWHEWLGPKSGKKIEALEPEDKGLGAAPGTYVKARLSDIRKERGLT
ncbi:MAG: class I poly(R)-hydroxyalkanoic acid synthase [Pseudomonadota bacterium]